MSHVHSVFFVSGNCHQLSSQLKIGPLDINPDVLCCSKSIEQGEVMVGSQHSTGVSYPHHCSDTIGCQRWAVKHKKC